MHPAIDAAFYGMAKLETWLAMKGFPEFTHCGSCRARRRNLRRMQEAEQQ